MKKLGFLLLTVLVAFIPIADALGSSLEKVAYVDLQRALNFSEAGKKAKEKFTQEVKKIEEELAKKQKELEKLKDALQKQSMLLNEEARKQKEKDYQTKLRDFQRLYKDAQDDLKQNDAEVSQEILKELVEVIKEFGEKGNYSIIFEKNESVVLYIKDTFDVTDKIIKIYNEKKK